jgi:hypothetical protein
MVAFAWWFAAGGLCLVSAVLFMCEVVILSAANPAARLPWIGWPANVPWRAKTLLLFAILPDILAMDFVTEALGRRHLFDVLWALPFALVVPVAGAVFQARHNRHVAGRPAHLASLSASAA